MFSVTHRIFYAAGPGNIIGAHEHWSRGEQDPTEVSMTFSSQVEECCRNANAPAYFVSSNAPPRTLQDGQFTLEHRPKPMPGARGIKYHFAEAIYALGLVRTAVTFKSTVAIIDSGTSHFFMGALFRLLGIPVITVLHNTIWPSGFPPAKMLPKTYPTARRAFLPMGLICDDRRVTGMHPAG